MKKRKMTALQKKYFGKGHHSCKPKKVSALAKKGKGSYARAKGFLGLGNIKGIVAPLAGGAGDRFLANYIPVRGVGAIVAGMFLGDHTTRQIGFYQLGYSGADLLLGGEIGGGLL